MPASPLHLVYFYITQNNQKRRQTIKFIIFITVWFYSFLPESVIEEAAKSLYRLLYKKKSKTKDSFKQEYPNYRKYEVDPNPPLQKKPDENQNLDYRQLLEHYRIIHGKELNPVKRQKNSYSIPETSTCPLCGAPHTYLYFNDGKKHSQLKCKLCSHLFQLNKRFQNSNKVKYLCPYCNHALFKWKERVDVTIYKCCNDNCPHRLKAIKRLNFREKKAFALKPANFKLCYQFREYHLTQEQLQTTAPAPSRVSLTKIHNTLNTLSLILSFHVSFALSARKTSLIMRSVFQINASPQTILNYAEAAAYYCHNFNLAHKGSVDATSVGDETYIKIQGKKYYSFFFLSPPRRSVTSYHTADNRGAIPAIVSMWEAKRTITPNKTVTFITDGNPSYADAVVYLNSLYPDKPSIEHHKVIGLKNLDSESETYRPFKQLMERFNRTYKHHIKPSYGFDQLNGAISLTTLFVTHYNFLRPHSSLNYETPVIIPELSPFLTIQGKWSKLLSMAFLIPPPFS